MEDLVFMSVMESFKYLFKNYFRCIFIQLSPFSYIIEKIASRSKLHDEDDVGVSFKSLVQANDVFMFNHFEYRHLLHHLVF